MHTCLYLFDHRFPMDSDPIMHHYILSRQAKGGERLGAWLQQARHMSH